MTTLLITAPAMAASFFGGTLGNFNPYPTVSGGHQNAGSPGPGGQPAGAYAPQTPQTMQTTTPNNSTGGGLGGRTTGAPSSPQSDTVKLQQSI